MKPSEKTPEIESFLTNIFGVNRQESIRNNKCVSCGKPAMEFSSEVERKEYTISGFCSTCQRKIFKKE